MGNTLNWLIEKWDAAISAPWVISSLFMDDVDQLMQISVLDVTLTAPPASPAEGDKYIIGASATGTWAGKDNNFTYYKNGAWRFKTMIAGSWIYNQLNNRYYSWDGTALNLITPASFDSLPAAVDDGPFTFSGTTPVTTTDVTANDNLGDGVDLATGVSYVAASLSGTGTLGADPVYNGDGTFTYTPSGSETSDVTFDYRITDTSGDTSDGTVTLELDVGGTVNYDDADYSTGDRQANITITTDFTVVGQISTLIDGVLSGTSFYFNNTDETNKEILMVLNAARNIGELKIIQQNNTTGTIVTKTQYSTDSGANWVDASGDIAWASNVAGGIITLDVPSGISCTHWRILGVSGSTNNNPYVYEIEIGVIS